MILRVIVSALQVIESRFTIIIVSAIPERIHFRQIALGRNHFAPRGIDIFCLHDAICVNDLDHVTLQIEDVIIGACNIAVNGVVKSKRAAGIIVEEVQCFCAQNRSADTLPDRFPCNFSVLREIFMRHDLGRGKRPVGLGQILLLDIRLFRRGCIRIRLDRLPRLFRRFGIDRARQDGVDDPDRHIIRADDLVACNALRVLTPRTGEAGFRGNIRII